MCAGLAACGDDGGNSGKGAPDGGGTSDRDSGPGGTQGPDGGGSGTDRDSGTVAIQSQSPLCAKDYPAQVCDGDPHGEWKLSTICKGTLAGCEEAQVQVTGTASASLRFDEGVSASMFYYEYDYDFERRVTIPQSCVSDKSCDSFNCFGPSGGPCSCTLGGSQGGSTSNYWTPRIEGEVVEQYGNDSELRFCAGSKTADSMIGGERVFWERVCSEGMDCRPSNPCHVGAAHCTDDEITCGDTSVNRPVGAVCGVDKVCDATGACVACAGGGSECALEGQPCKRGVISCSSATPVCRFQENRADGSACGDNGQCDNGVCKLPDGAPCQSNSQCEDACTCGDAQCSTRYCGQACPCGYAPAGGACAGFLEDGEQDPAFCASKACFHGQCLVDIGQSCTADSACGSGHCTCWLPNCTGGRLCSKMACPCQWASSGEDACGGPLTNGVSDSSCTAPQMCVDGACQ